MDTLEGLMVCIAALFILVTFHSTLYRVVIYGEKINQGFMLNSSTRLYFECAEPVPTLRWDMIYICWEPLPSSSKRTVALYTVSACHGSRILRLTDSVKSFPGTNRKAVKHLEITKDSITPPWRFVFCVHLRWDTSSGITTNYRLLKKKRDSSMKMALTWPRLGVTKYMFPDTFEGIFCLDPTAVRLAAPPNTRFSTPGKHQRLQDQ